MDSLPRGVLIFGILILNVAARNPIAGHLSKNALGDFKTGGHLTNLLGLRSRQDQILTCLHEISTFCPKEVQLQIASEKAARPNEKFTDLFRTHDPSAAIVPPSVAVKQWPLNWAQISDWKVTALSHEHGVFHVEDFLSEEEADSLVNHYGSLLQVAGAHAKSRVDKASCTARRSSTIWTPSAPLAVQRKIQQLTGRGPEHYEPLSVTRYDQGGFFSDHYDSLGTDGREITVLLNLNNAEGGATYFPDLNLRSKPRRGSALVFFLTLPGSHTVNGWSRHCGEDAGSTKWVAQQWVRSTPVPQRSKGIPGVAWFGDGSALHDHF